MLKLSEINALDLKPFTLHLRPVFEHSPWVAARTASQRPFAAPRRIVVRPLSNGHASDTTTKNSALIRAHPDLVGKRDPD